MWSKQFVEVTASKLPSKLRCPGYPPWILFQFVQQISKSQWPSPVGHWSLVMGGLAKHNVQPF